MVRPSTILVTTVFLVGSLTACRRMPERPASVPPEAQWCAEAREGVFLKVGGHQGTLWQLEVWDRDGRPLAAGPFRLRGFAKARIVSEEVQAWENGVLQLRDGTVMVPEKR